MSGPRTRTKYEYDSETGLYYAKARYYNPRLGRFMSADPLAGDVTDPQSLNRYAYVMNGPTALIDPAGMDNCVPGKGAGRYVSCQSGGNDGQEDGGLVGMPTASYTLDGVDISPELLPELGGSYGICPGTCLSFAKDTYTGQMAWLDYTVDAAGTSGWLSGYDWTQGVRDWNGAFVSNAQYQLQIQIAYAQEIEAQREALAKKIAADTRGKISYATAYAELDPDGGHLQGGNWNFVLENGLGPNSLLCGGADRCDGIHFVGGFAHLDTSNPFAGDVWSFLEHTGVDVLGGNIVYYVIPR